ncbi:hypothetical protein [Bacillus toyonensis]|uniref:Lantibiotic n=1 Tax=Bacillus toyonensis TaxID=155322 RepID=A0AB73S5D2_9BACI|nr:hypothetical protein [Bacillus toyonensis]PEI83396.1 hypothetical protein CN678_24035 [Bacillus toyonensis]
MNDKKFSNEDVKEIVKGLTQDLISRLTSELDLPIEDAGGSCGTFVCREFGCGDSFICHSSFGATLR